MYDTGHDSNDAESDFYSFVYTCRHWDHFLGHFSFIVYESKAEESTFCSMFIGQL